MTTTGMDASDYRERLYAAFADRDCDAEERIQRGLEIGMEYFDLHVGFLTRIDDETQTVIQSTGEHDLIQPGESCPLDRAYCRRTVEMDEPLAAESAAKSPDIAQRAIDTFDLGTYLGTQVRVDDETYGTVCFADGADGACSFSEADRLFIELLAKLVGQALERRRHKRALREQNERLAREKRRFEGIAETSFDILFRVGLDGELTYVSSAVERILGYDPDDLVGRVFGDILPPDVEEAATVAYAQVMAGDRAENLELDFLDACGERVPIEVNATPIEEAGEIVGVQGVGRDVSDRREREAELRLKNRAMDEADLGIVIADPSQRQEIVYVNRGFARLTGYDRSDVIGNNWDILDGPATDSELAATIPEHVEAGESATVELVNYRADGTPFWNRIRIDPITDADGDLSQVLAFHVDVTERKRTEKLIALLNRVLRHNLRNDMNALLGYGALLQEDNEGVVSEYGRRIRSVAESLVGLSEQARTLERTARQDRNPQRLDTAALLGAVVEDARENHPGATISLSVDAGRDICAGPELQRAVGELLENALSHNGGPEPWVGVEANDDGGWIEVTVADNGPGIEEVEARVIARGHETDLEHGTGLGLWLVNWIVTRYGGSFQIAAREDGGSVATLCLPAVGEDASVEAAERRPTVLFR